MRCARVSSTTFAAAPRPAAPKTEFAFEALVDIGPTRMLGKGPLGERRIVPITGGSFEGPRLRGKVLAGGADRQLVRADGVTQLAATYELETEDGAVISVLNKVTSYQPPGGAPRYLFSALEFAAPEGPHDWLNKAVFVGTLVPMMPQRQAVRITVYRLV